MSIHKWKAMNKAASLGAYGGESEAKPVWDLPKRELVEIALRLGERCGDDFSVEGAVNCVMEERRILKQNKLI